MTVPPPAAPAARSSLVGSAVAELRRRIADGEWPVGSRIPTEPELVHLLHVGRNTVREAVQSLAHAGLLERRQGSGTYVLARSELTVTIGREIDGASRRHVLEMRRALEVEAARLAALHRSEAEVVRLRELDAAREAAARRGDVDAFVVADLALHRTIAAAAGNPVLDSLYVHLLDAVGENIRENVLAGAAGSHTGLVDAVASGDEEAAAREITTYLTRQIARLPEHP